MVKIYPITVPQWGLEMTEGTISEWHIAVGDRIEKGCDIVDIETAKIVNTMDAKGDMPGVVRRLLAKEGDTLAVGGLLAVVAEADVSDAEIDSYLSAQSGLAAVPEEVAHQVQAPAVEPAPDCAALAEPVAHVETPHEVRSARNDEEFERIIELNAAVNASPVARRVANRAGIDISMLEGRGRHGRVSLEDVQASAPGLNLASVQLPALAPEQLQQRNRDVHASPVARRLANRSQVDLTALRGTGRGGRVSVADIEAALRASRPSVVALPVSQADLRAGPAARKLAAELGIDIASLPATGPRKVVLKDDVQEAFKSVLQQQLPEAQEVDHQLIPLTPMRKAIAASLTHSKQNIPHFYLTVDLQLDSLIALRQAINAQSEGRGKLSLNDFLLRAVAMALKEVPEANVHFTEAGIKQFSGVHLCVAVAIDGGLVTPVIRNAEAKGVFAIAAEVAELAERARSRSLTQAQLGGGTFTVSNLGMFGIRQFDAVINPPQGAILAVGGVRREACETAEGGIEFRSLMSVTLSCDHRAIDGAVGAAFLSALRKWLERPYALLG